MGETGWYGEDRPEGAFIVTSSSTKMISRRERTTSSVFPRWARRTGTGLCEKGETWMHRDGLEKQVWALFSWDGAASRWGERMRSSTRTTPRRLAPDSRR